MEIQGIDNIYENIPGDVLATFSTKESQKFRVDSSPLSLLTQMDENALDLLVKGLLNDQVREDELLRIKFQFVIQNQMLRGKIKSHLVRYNIASEQTLEIEYFIAIYSPEQKNQNQEDDWISVITSMPRMDSKSYYGVGLYNGQVSIYDFQDKLIAKHQVSEDSIKTMKIIPSAQEGKYYLISGGLDQVGKLHRMSASKKGFEFEEAATFVGNHPSQIYAIDASPMMDGMFCSAGGNNRLSIWRIPSNIDQQPSHKKTSLKKAKLDHHIISPEGTNQVHDGQILSLLWFSDSEIYTGSADHTIKVIDVERLEPSSTIYTKDSVTTSIDGQFESILSSHEDGYIRLWDKRTNSQIKSFKSHNKYASCVRFSQTANIFASCSYDHTVKIWDTRSIFPLQTLSPHHDKVFSIFWKDHNELVSGGSDSKLCTFTSILESKAQNQ